MLWKYIRKGQKGGDAFHHFLNFKVADGSSIKFLHDLWYEGLPLKNNFPENYTVLLVIRMHQWLSCYLFQKNSNLCNIVCLRPDQDWELESVVTFMDLMDKLC